MMILEELKQAGEVDVDRDPAGATKRVQEIRAKRLSAAAESGFFGAERKQSSWDLLRLHRTLGLEFHHKNSMSRSNSRHKSIHGAQARNSSHELNQSSSDEVLAAAAVAAFSQGGSANASGRGMFRWDDDELTIEQLISNQTKERKKRAKGSQKMFAARSRIENALWAENDTMSLFGMELTMLPNEMGLLTSVRVLDLSCNQLNKLSKQLAKMTNLIVLDANNNQLTSIPDELTALSNLTQLNLGMNRLMSLPEEFGKFCKLDKLDVSQNMLIELPESIGDCYNLTKIDVWGNRLTHLPERLGEVSPLKILRARENKLTQIPLSMKNLQLLRVLQLDGNQLSALPPEIAEMTSMEMLTLSDNPMLVSPPVDLLYPPDRIPNDYDDFNRVNEVIDFFSSLLPRVGTQRTTLANSLKDTINSDLVVIVDGQRILAHKVILSARCTRLRTLIQQLDDQGKAFNFKVGQRKDELVLHDISYPVFISMMEYMYADNIVSDMDYAADLEIAAGEYKMDRLKRMCAQFVTPFLDVAPEEFDEIDHRRLQMPSQSRTGQTHVKPVVYPSRVMSTFGMRPGSSKENGQDQEEEQRSSSNSRSRRDQQHQPHPYDSKERYAFYLDGYHALPLHLQNNTLADDLESIFNYKLFGDVIFEIEGRLLHAHKIILTTRCEHFGVLFELMLDNGGKRGKEKEPSQIIPISGYSYVAYEKLLRYVYCGRIELDSLVALELLTAAHEYELDVLKQRCERFLAKRLTRDSVLENFKIAYTHEAHQLLEYCFHYVLACHEDLIQEDLYHSLPKKLLMRVEERRIPAEWEESFPWERTMTRNQNKQRPVTVEGRYSRMSQRSESNLNNLANYRSEFRSNHVSLYNEGRGASSNAGNTNVEQTRQETESGEQSFLDDHTLIQRIEEDSSEDESEGDLLSEEEVME
eukprot:TRINITY_DN3493_c0_g3_i1.p1 TRINITY_DN3493_c0_g3~~TRINITY_DN3493_c0_g3_i1.p1  ORF type:complete len:924 (+),score=294.34 TRINITY_DN3493_c0_g3_i1:638-3409(+)